MTPTPRFTVTVREAATLLGIGRDAAYAAVHSGQVPSLRIGRRILVPTAALRELVGLPPEMSEPGSATEPGTATIHATGALHDPSTLH